MLIPAAREPKPKRRLLPQQQAKRPHQDSS